MNKAIKITIGICLLGAAAAAAGFAGYRYYGGRTFYQDHFYQGIHYTVLKPDGSTICAEGVLDDMTVEEAVAKIEEDLADYSLTIAGYDDTADVIEGADIRFGTIEDPQEIINHAMQEQDAAHWYRYRRDGKQVYKDCPITFHYTYDEQALSRRMASLQVLAPEDPVESTVSKLVYNEDTHYYEFIPPKTGNIGDESLIVPKITDAVYQMQPKIELTEEDYLKAEDDQAAFLQEKEAEINQYLKASITLKDGDKSIVIDKDTIIDFLDITEDWEVTLVTKRLQNFINQNLDPLFDTKGRTRVIETPGSGRVEVSGGTFGKVVRTLYEVQQMTEEITEGKTVERLPIYYENYITTEENDEVGYDYIDINITDQMVYVVKEGQIVYETPCVTGLDTEERRTPTGVYFVIRKARDYTMVKYDAFVHYWLPINDTTGVGLHDADWRGSFGGSIYKSNGSHGCINLPPAAAAKIYEIVPTGMTVIVHE